MPGDVSETLAEEIQRATFKDEAPSILPVSALYIGAHTGPTGNDGETNEVDAADYARLETSPSDWTVTIGTGEVIVENDVEVQFKSADSNWGTVEEVSAWDTESGGNCLWVKGAIDPTTIEENDRLSFEPGNIAFTLG